MSLATFLLGTKSSSKKVIDTGLDAIFHSKAKEVRPSSSSNGHPTVAKKKRGHGVHADEPDRKRPKSSVADSASSSVPPPRKQNKTGKNRVGSAPEPVTELETSDAGKSESSKIIPLNKSGSESSDEDGGDPSTLIHESLRKNKLGKPASKKTKYAPSDETKERRDARTIFVGNLLPDVATKRPLKNQLHRHILASLPTTKIESIRFRSLAFQTPTSKLPEVSDEVKKNNQPRQHERDRASSWRDAHTADESQTNENKFLTPSQKKKIAFINRDIHSDAHSVHAYIVFAYPSPPHTRPVNLPPPRPVMDPFEAARLAIERCNGTVFLDRTLRVDAVTKRSTTGSSSDGTLPSSIVGDPKLTIFVGNLDFTSKEEDLRLFFEGIMSAERGPDTEGSQDGDKPKRWVSRVRLIRDKDTQLGKGFAYVQFSDRNCVDEILALEPGKLKFAKRKLRVQRCKSIPGAANKGVPPSKPVQTSNNAPVPVVPKGNPSLGEKLVKLTKEERKRVKATDVDRVARRMAKKKARIALAKQGAPLQNKQRERVRKTGQKLGNKPLKKTSKERVRSEKSIAKRNAKK